MTRLPIQQLDIPDRQVDIAVGQIVIAAMRESGMNPSEAWAIPLVREMAARWARGEMRRHEFMRACENMLILNPTLKEQS